MKKEDEKIVMNFWNTYKGVLRKFHPNVRDEGHMDFITMLQICEDTNFEPTKYKKIFESSPAQAQDNMLKFLNVERDDFIKRLKKSIIAYRQEISRIEDEEASE